MTIDPEKLSKAYVKPELTPLEKLAEKISKGLSYEIRSMLKKRGRIPVLKRFDGAISHALMTGDPEKVVREIAFCTAYALYGDLVQWTGETAEHMSNMFMEKARAFYDQYQYEVAEAFLEAQSQKEFMKEKYGHLRGSVLRVKMRKRERL